MENEEETIKRKNSVRNDDIYKRNVIKRSKVEGIAHTSYSGKLVPARVTGPPCK